MPVRKSRSSAKKMLKKKATPKKKSVKPNGKAKKEIIMPAKKKTVPYKDYNDYASSQENNS